MKAWLSFAVILVIYVLVRVLAWTNATILDDNDSPWYLYTIDMLSSFDLRGLMELSPDRTLFYPFFGALFSLPGWSSETGARLASLAFSIGLFFIVIAIGKRFMPLEAVAIGALILALNPILLAMSVTVLTEASYIATIYFGFWIFLTQYQHPTKASALLLGIVFALGFVNRTEGILLLIAVPIMQFVHLRIQRNKLYTLPHFSTWVLLFVMGFSIVALPQIWWISSKMGGVAINGRQTWVQIFNNPDGKSYEEKVYGLDYSPDTVNLAYLQSHPEARKQLSSSFSAFQVTREFVANYINLYRQKLNELFAPFGLIFFGFGVLALFSARRYYELLAISIFMAALLIGPLGYSGQMRHFAIIAPMVIILQGAGIIYLSEVLLGRNTHV